MKGMRYLERTWSFIFNLACAWVILIGIYGACLAQWESQQPRILLSILQFLIIVWPLITIVLLINRNLARRSKWVDWIAIPKDTFYLTDYTVSKLVFKDDCLQIDRRFIIFTYKSMEVKYNNIHEVRMALTRGVQDALTSIGYRLYLYTETNSIEIDITQYATDERVIILKVLKCRNPDIKFNKRAKMYLHGFFLLKA
jgi:hypothetical protein